MYYNRIPKRNNSFQGTGFFFDFGGLFRRIYARKVRSCARPSVLVITGILIGFIAGALVVATLQRYHKAQPLPAKVVKAKKVKYVPISE